MIVAFGGAFNPPTIAHFQIAKFINQQLPCDSFFFLPVGDLYPKGSLIASYHRINMLKLVCKQLDHKAAVCEIETTSHQVLTTFESLNLLKKKYQNQEIAFVMGADNLKELKTWVQFEQLLNHFQLILFKRNDLDIEKIIARNFGAYKERFIILDSFGEMNVSSTLYRENKDNESLVLKSVSDYIKSNHLYGRN